MREIKYRAYIKELNSIQAINEISWNDDGTFDFGIKNSADWYCSEDYVIEQFTGLHDKNGVEIYENDVVRIRNGNGYETFVEEVEVTWDEYGFSPMNWQYECDGCSIYHKILEIEVIGNIHERSEDNDK